MINKLAIYKILIIIEIALLSFWVGLFIDSEFNAFNRMSSIIYSEDLNLSKEVYDIYSNIRPIFKYNITNIHKELNESQLIEEGGVCWHWTDWYIREGNKRNITTQKIDIKLNETLGHRFAVMFDKDEYCIVDENSYPICRKLI